MGRSPAFVACAASAILAGCVDAGIVRCADGTVCPAGTVCQTGGGCVVPEGLYVPDGIVDLGDVDCGATAEQTITVGNFEATAIDVTTRSTLSSITVEPAAARIEPGAQLDVRVTVDTAAQDVPGATEGAIYFTTATTPISRVVQYRAVGGVVRGETQSLDFGQATLAAPPAPRAVEVHNDGNAPMTIDTAITGAAFAVAGPTTIEIAAGTSRMIDVEFAPGDVGMHAGTLTVTPTGSVCGDAEASFALSGTIVDDATPILLSREIVDHGATGCAGMSASETITVTSNINQVQALSFALSGPAAGLFSLSETSAPLAAFGTVDLTITRASIPIPTVPGSRTATLTVDSSFASYTTISRQDVRIEAPYLEVPQVTYDLGVIPQMSLAEYPVALTNGQGNRPGTMTVTPSTYNFIGMSSISMPATVALDAGASVHADLFAVGGSVAIGVYDLMFAFNVAGQCNVATGIAVNFSVDANNTATSSPAPSPALR
jgi:hypothetical protein